MFTSTSSRTLISPAADNASPNSSGTTLWDSKAFIFIHFLTFSFIMRPTYVGPTSMSGAGGNVGCL